MEMQFTETQPRTTQCQAECRFRRDQKVRNAAGQAVLSKRSSFIPLVRGSSPWSDGGRSFATKCADEEMHAQTVSQKAV